MTTTNNDGSTAANNTQPSAPMNQPEQRRPSVNWKPRVGAGKQLLIWVPTMALFVLAFLGWTFIVEVLLRLASEQFGPPQGMDALTIAQIVALTLGVAGGALGTIMVGRAWIQALKYRQAKDVAAAS